MSDFLPKIPDDLFNFTIKDKKDCKGQIFKCVVNNHIDTNGSYVQKFTMKMLRRKSCKGCQYCEYLDEYAREEIDNVGEILVDNPQHNALYQLSVVNITTDWETGFADDFDMEFVKIGVGHE